MAAVTINVSTEFMTRSRAAIVFEHPELEGQTNAQLHEYIRQEIIIKRYKTWLRGVEAQMRAANETPIAAGDVT